jgi:hypothetical protein
MATYTPVPKSVPSAQRSTQVTAVAAGDQIDFTDVLGRPARRIQFITTDAADVVGYTLNSLRKLRTEVSNPYSDLDKVSGVYGTQEVEVWSGGEGYANYQSTGSTVIETVEGLSISSVQIDALTLSAGTTITIICW